jgi:hypothetical protein
VDAVAILLLQVLIDDLLIPRDFVRSHRACSGACAVPTGRSAGPRRGRISSASLLLIRVTAVSLG